MFYEGIEGRNALEWAGELHFKTEEQRHESCPSLAGGRDDDVASWTEPTTSTLKPNLFNFS